MKRLFRRFFLYIRKFASDVPGSPAASLQRYRKTRLWLIGAALPHSSSLSNMSIENVAVPKDRVTTHNGGTQMQYQITGGQLPVVMCYLDEGESMITESGGMSWMSPNMRMETQGTGGFGKMMGRMFSGESMFQNVQPHVLR